jgi:hypothetical protein
VLVVPNLLLFGAIFFSVAALTRSLMATYASVVAFFVGLRHLGSLLEDIENETISALLDPFGFNAFGIATRYWTVFDKNTKLLPIGGVFLWNRLLWIGVALAILAFAYWKFEFTTGTRKAKKKSRRAQKAEELSPPMTRISLAAAGGRRRSAARRRGAVLRGLEARDALRVQEHPLPDHARLGVPTSGAAPSPPTRSSARTSIP